MGCDSCGKGTTMVDDAEVETHESYGMIGFNRVSCGGTVDLFGSPIRDHRTTVRLHLYHGKRIHESSYDRYSSDSRVPIAEVELSAHQFSELLTTMNVGDGVPCTIRCLNGKQIENPPHRELEAEKVQSGFKTKAKEFVDHLKTRLKEAHALLGTSGAIKVADRRRIGDLLDEIVREVGSNMPYRLQLFEEATESMKNTAKAEIDAFITQVSHITGMNRLREEALEHPQLVAPAKEDP